MSWSTPASDTLRSIADRVRQKVNTGGAVRLPPLPTHLAQTTKSSSEGQQKMSARNAYMMPRIQVQESVPLLREDSTHNILLPVEAVRTPREYLDSIQRARTAATVSSSGGLDSVQSRGEAIDDRNDEQLMEISVAEKRKQVTDPFVAKQPKFKFPKVVWAMMFVIPSGALVLLLVCIGFDMIIGWTTYDINDMWYQLLLPDPDTGSNKVLFNGILMTMCLAYSTVISLVAIVADVAAERFSSSVNSVLMREKKIVGFIGFVLVTNILSFIAFMTAGARESLTSFYTPRTSVFACMFSVILSVVGVFPLAVYLFFFLDAQKVITEIVDHGLQGINESVKDPDGRNVDSYMMRAISSIEDLRSCAHRGIVKKDHNTAAKSIDALCSFQLCYARTKLLMFQHWYFMPAYIRHHPDFKSLTDEAILEICDKKTWIEWKILKQYLELYNNAIIDFKELCYHIAMNTRLIGEAAGAERFDVHTVDLCIKYFNTYIRYAINQKNTYIVYIVLFQYRKLAEFFTEFTTGLREITASDDKQTMDNIRSLEECVLQIAKYMRYYSFQAMSVGLIYIVEVVHHDIRHLCEIACSIDAVNHDALLDVFLTIDENADKNGVAMEGVRIAQVILATSYLNMRKPQYARRIYQMCSKDRDRLGEVYRKLQHVVNREFWEVSERGTRFEYLTEDQKAQLPVFWSWFDFKPMTPRDLDRFSKLSIHTSPG
ncbi:hypothetical protein PROFUN_08076 [Planoprotostelium fungivorum]|uniref:Uncharacterized protein n=1 Tax=Planoprotostelium fungivorum TaxID=1890364 RepID=A0A2P6NKK5_9EUKA|nr:hypothetical protein PROFUN_08076 [Planoprotostelium fungivorum]